MARNAFAHRSGSEVKTSAPFELIHSDVVGPITPKSKGGAQYVVTFIDDFSRFVFVFVYLLKGKGEVYERFRELLALATT